MVAGSYHVIAFQSTRPRGARHRALLTLNPASSFNPRAHEGRDHQYLFLEWKIKSFNPRAHEGRDRVVDRLSPVENVSIHAPTRGATLTRYPSSVVTGFNPRAHEGRDAN